MYNVNWVYLPKALCQNEFKLRLLKYSSVALVWGGVANILLGECFHTVPQVGSGTIPVSGFC